MIFTCNLLSNHKNITVLQNLRDYYMHTLSKNSIVYSFRSLLKCFLMYVVD